VVGLMRGVLEYRDYGNGRRVTLPTAIHTAPIGATGAYRQRTIYDDGPGNTIYSSDVLRISGDRWLEDAGGDEGHVGAGQTVLRIISRQLTTDGTVLVLRGRGMDDEQTVEFRYTVTLGGTTLTRLKEFRRPGKRWAYRHEYRLRRAATTP
jgi:hypothetical protein